jgi:hypothetical protein
MGDEFREFHSFAKLLRLRKKRVSRNTKIAKTKQTWSKKSSLVIPNRYCEESTKSKPNHHVNARYRVDTKWRFKFFAKYDYRFMLDVIIAITANFSLFHNYRYVFCISDNCDYFLYNIDHNYLGVLTKCISQNNNDSMYWDYCKYTGYSLFFLIF